MVDFLLVLIELFSLGVTAEALRAIIGSKLAISLQRGPVYPKFQIERVAPTNHSFTQKTRLIRSSTVNHCTHTGYIQIQNTIK